MNKNELAQKALEIIGECSSRKGKVRLYNSLLFVELNIDACIPKLNELYNTNVSREEVKNPITITIKPEFGVVKSYFVCSDKGHTLPADKMPA